MWQKLREELFPKGLEIVTVALDTGGAEVARPFIEKAQPRHPSLIDQAHRLDELFGIVNVPSGVWIDEMGIIVRPPEPAFPAQPTYLSRTIPENAPSELKARLAEVKKIRIEPEKYVKALRDWVEKGPDSPYALSPDEVLERSRPRPFEEALAAANFDLGQYLHLSGRPEAAVNFFRLSHRLQSDNWTYRRQAWSLLDPTQGPSQAYESDWFSDLKKIGAENYYPALKMD